MSGVYLLDGRRRCREENERKGDLWYVLDSLILKFVIVMSNSDMLTAITCSSNIIGLPIHIPMASQELVFWIREGGKKDRMKEMAAFCMF